MYCRHNNIAETNRNDFHFLELTAFCISKRKLTALVGTRRKNNAVRGIAVTPCVKLHLREKETSQNRQTDTADMSVVSVCLFVC